MDFSKAGNWKSEYWYSIKISVSKSINFLEVKYISDKEIMRRKEKWNQPDLKIKKGILYKYLKSVTNASNGCVTDE